MILTVYGIGAVTLLLALAPGDLMTRREVAYKFRVTSAAVATWARRNLLAEVRDEQGRPRYRRADVEELYASGFRGGRRRG